MFVATTRFFVPLLAFIFAITASALLTGSILKEGYREFIGIAIAFLLFSLHPLTFWMLINIITPQTSNIPAVTVILRLLNHLVAAAFILMWYAMVKLAGKDMGLLRIMVILLFVEGTAFFSSSINPTIYPYWGFVFTPKWAHLTMGIPLLAIVFDMIRISFPTGMSTRNTAGKYMLMGWILLGLGIAIAAFERLFVSIYTTGYMAVSTMGFVLISLALLKDPFVLVPNVIHGQLLLISDRRSGTTLYKRRLNTDANLSENLFSPAMKGILDVMNELTGTESIPEVLGYNDLKIVVARTDRFIGYFVCRRSISPLRKALARLLEDLEKEVSISHLSRESIKKLDQTIRNKLSFAF